MDTNKLIVVCGWVMIVVGLSIPLIPNYNTDQFVINMSIVIILIGLPFGILGLLCFIPKEETKQDIMDVENDTV